MMRKAMASMACRAREAVSSLTKASTSCSLMVCTRIELVPWWSYGPRQLLTNLPGRQSRHPGIHMPRPTPGSFSKLGTNSTAVRQYQSLQFPARCALPCHAAACAHAPHGNCRCAPHAQALPWPACDLKQACVPGRTTYMQPFSAETALRLLVAANAAVFCG